MNKTYIVLGLTLIAIVAVFLFRNNSINNSIQETSSTLNSSATTTTSQSVIDNTKIQNNSNIQNISGFVQPLERASERVTKKPFGIFITPQNSPVQPEIFHGYHTGTDFEIFPGEKNIDISVRAVCSGKLEMKKYAIGYGGMAVESCTLNNEPITVIYGHLKLSSISNSVGNNLKAGDIIGILGAGYSTETDGERKNLHLGFYKGTSINILGYVQTQGELSNWINACLYVCQK